MIDITDSLVKLAKTVKPFRNRVYRRYPIKAPTSPFMTISPFGRSTVLVEDDGSELVANLVYLVEIYDKDQERLDSLVESVNNVFNSRTALCTSRTPDYDNVTELYSESLVYSVTVDKRGATYKM